MFKRMFFKVLEIYSGTLLLFFLAWGVVIIAMMSLPISCLKPIVKVTMPLSVNSAAIAFTLFYHYLLAFGGHLTVEVFAIARR